MTTRAHGIYVLAFQLQAVCEASLPLAKNALQSPATIYISICETARSSRLRVSKYTKRTNDDIWLKWCLGIFCIYFYVINCEPYKVFHQKTDLDRKAGMPLVLVAPSPQTVCLTPKSSCIIFGCLAC